MLKQPGDKRIYFLDGFRGIAILLVILYHAYYFWASLVPYGERFASVPFFNGGWIGVRLFFLISGFVILMSLEKTRSFLQFISNRWLRLFPAMLAATLLIFTTARLLPERPDGIPSTIVVIPGLFFIDPHWIHTLTGVDTGRLEGAFWSLFVEVKYYFIFGLLYYYLGKKRAITGIFLCYLTWLTVMILTESGVGGRIVVITEKITDWFSFKQFGWFASGSLAWLYYSDRNKKYLLYALITGLLSTVSMGLFFNNRILPGCIILFIFIATVYFDLLKRIFANRFFIFLGFISYPLYLIHGNAMIALIIKTGKQFPGIPAILLPVLPILFLILIAWLIAKIVEPAIRKPLNNYMIRPLLRSFKSQPTKPTATE